MRSSMPSLWIAAIAAASAGPAGLISPGPGPRSVPAAGVALARPGREDQEQAGVGRRGDRVALVRVERGQQAGRLLTAVAVRVGDLDLAVGDDEPGAARAPGARRGSRRRASAITIARPSDSESSTCGDCGSTSISLRFQLCIVATHIPVPRLARCTHDGDRNRRPRGGRKVNRRARDRRGAGLHLPRLGRHVPERRAGGARRRASRWTTARRSGSSRAASRSSSTARAVRARRPRT